MIERSIIDQQDEEKYTDFKFVVFHCSDQDMQNRLTSETQFCLVGDYLCLRDRKELFIWIIRLKSSDEDFVPITYQQEDGSNSSIDRSFKSKQSWKMFEGKALSIEKIVRREHIDHI